MWGEPAANIYTLDLIEVVVGQDRSKLQWLIEGRRNSCGFEVVKCKNESDLYCLSGLQRVCAGPAILNGLRSRVKDGSYGDQMRTVSFRVESAFFDHATRVASAAKARNLTFMLNSAFGPNRLFTHGSVCCGAARHSGHSLRWQNQQRG